MMCKKIVVHQPGAERPYILYGLILSEDEKILNFKTRKSTYKFNKEFIVSINDTKMPYSEIDPHGKF